MTNDLKQSSFAYSQHAWLIWLTGMTFLLFQYTLQMSSGVLIKPLAITFSLSAFQAGTLSASYYYIYVLLQIPAGILCDRFGARLVLSLGSLLCGIGCFLFACAQSITTAEIGRILMGSGGALSYVGVLFLIHHWFLPRRFGLMVGLVETIGLVSIIFGNIYLANFVSSVGWRYIMLLAAITSIIIACACWLIIRDTPNSKKLMPTINMRHFLQEVKKLSKSMTLWLNGIYNGLLYSVLTVFVALWGIPFISLKYGISLPLATIIDVSFFAGAAIGCPCAAWAAERFHNIRQLLLFGAFVPAGLMILIIYTTPPLWLMFILMLITGFCLSPYILSFALSARLAPASSRATCIGFTNCLGMCTAPIFQMLVGLLMDINHRGSGEVIVGHYFMGDYYFALATFPILLIIAGFIAMFLNFQEDSVK